MKVAQSLHCKPLHEINLRISEADRAYEDLVFDLQEVNVSEQEVGELHEIVNQPENPRSVDRRPLYPAKEIYAR